MKKFWKITGITAASLAGATLIAIGIIVWVVFTPARLTPIVRNVAADYVTCEHEIGRVELTFFSTFPRFGLAIDGVQAVNPTAGAPCDTVARIDRLTAEIDLQRLWRDHAIALSGLHVEGASICLYADTTGRNNYDILALPPSTTEDTNTPSLPFDPINLGTITLTDTHLSYTDRAADMEAHTDGLNLTADLSLTGNQASGTLHMNSPAVWATIGGVNYTDGLSINMNLPFEADMEAMTIDLHKASMAINQYAIHIDGRATLPDNGDIITDLTIGLNNWELAPLVQLVPDTFAHLLDGLDLNDGLLTLQASISGTMNDSLMPTVDATLELAQGDVQYSALPYHLHDIETELSAHLNLNDSTDTRITIDHLSAKTLQSAIGLHGTVDQLLADMQIALTVDADLHLPDMKPVLPADMDVQLAGRTKGSITARFAMSQLEHMDVDKMLINGALDMTHIDVAYGGLTTQTPQAHLRIELPNKGDDAKTNFMKAVLTAQDLQMTQGDLTAVNTTGQTLLTAATSDLLKGDRLTADVTLHSDDIAALYGTMAGKMEQANITAAVDMNLKDTAAVPNITAAIDMANLRGTMDTLDITLNHPRLTARISPAKRNPTEPTLKVEYNGKQLGLTMGNAIKVSTDTLHLSASARHRTGAKNALLEWNPRVNVNLQQGLVEMAGFEERIEIPEIGFAYSNRDFTIEDSRIKIGRSDFGLKGEIHNIRKFLNKKGLLTGELEFTSDMTDVNELMALVSGLGSSEEDLAEDTPADTPATAPTQPHEEAMPFIVPKGIDLTLNTHIGKALVGKQVATNLGGRLYVKDGTLILEEMGFICDAARLQLTAMYRSPRPNHLYVGLDYHMTNIQIDELVNMIPQVDSILPMLRSFKGKGEFHLAAETNMNRNYELKMSTLRGAASIHGEDLVLLDGETFSQIAKIMLFKKKTENKIDSISAEATVFRNEVDIYPFLVTMDKYKVALGGRHNLDMTFNYHLSLLSPLRIGVDVSGNFDKLKIRPVKCRYAKDFLPADRKTVETQSMSLREVIRKSLTENMKP